MHGNLPASCAMTHLMLKRSHTKVTRVQDKKSAEILHALLKNAFKQLKGHTSIVTVKPLIITATCQCSIILLVKSNFR